MVSQVLINGLVVGSLYAFIASGFSLNYLVKKFSDFSYGSFVILSGYFLYLFYNCLGINIIISIILVLISSIISGFIIHFLVWKPLHLRHASNLIFVIVYLCLGTLLEALIQINFGTEIKSIGLQNVTTGYHILGGTITQLQIIIIAVTFLLFFTLYFIFKKTKIGKTMLALADNYELSKIYGLKPGKIHIKMVIILSVIASIGGIFIALEQNIYPTMGFGFAIKGFTGSIIASITNVPGSIIGSLILGIIENISVVILPSTYKDAVAFTILFIILIVRPQGLFSKNIRKD